MSNRKRSQIRSDNSTCLYKTELFINFVSRQCHKVHKQKLLKRMILNLMKVGTFMTLLFLSSFTIKVVTPMGSEQRCNIKFPTVQLILGHGWD